MRKHSGPVDRRDAACSEMLRESAVMANSSNRKISQRQQEELVVHFLVGRCLHRSLLERLKARGLLFFGRGWTQAHMSECLAHWALNEEVFGPPGTSKRFRQSARAATTPHARRKLLIDFLSRRSEEATSAAKDIVGACGGALIKAAKAIEDNITGVGEFKSGDVVLDLCEPPFGLWPSSVGRGLGSVLLRASNHSRARWYAGEGTRIALNACAGRPLDGCTGGEFDSELNDLTETVCKLLKGLVFGKARRPFNIAMSEYNLCEYMGFLSRSKQVRASHSTTPAVAERGGGGALTRTGHREEFEWPWPKRAKHDTCS